MIPRKRKKPLLCRIFGHDPVNLNLNIDLNVFYAPSKGGSATCRRCEQLLRVVHENGKTTVVCEVEWAPCPICTMLDRTDDCGMCDGTGKTIARKVG